MSTKAEVLNLFDEFNDYRNTLNDVVCVYNIGNSKITFIKPFALVKSEQDRLIRNQFISQAVANEYNKIQEEYQEILKSNITREGAERAYELRTQSDSKLVELNYLTIEYIEILGSLQQGNLEKIIKSQLPEHLANVELTDFVNKMFQNITEKINSTEVKATEVKFDEQKKLSPNESENIVNSLETSFSSLEDTTDYLVLTH